MEKEKVYNFRGLHDRKYTLEAVRSWEEFKKDGYAQVFQPLNEQETLWTEVKPNMWHRLPDYSRFVRLLPGESGSCYNSVGRITSC
jgi:hypothetical protein